MSRLRGGNPSGGNTDPMHPDGRPSVLNDGKLPDVGPYESPDEASRRLPLEPLAPDEWRISGFGPGIEVVRD